jgi:hypothetical protein
MSRHSSMITFWLACAPSLLLAQTCGNSQDPVQVIQTQLDAYNAHNLDAFAACYADDVTITDLSGKRPIIHGVAALKTTYAFLPKAPKGFHADLVQRSSSGPIVVDHERLMGLPPEKGQPEAFAVYEVRNGKIQNVWFPPAK